MHISNGCWMIDLYIISVPFIDTFVIHLSTSNKVVSHKVMSLLFGYCHNCVCHRNKLWPRGRLSSWALTRSKKKYLFLAVNSHITPWSSLPFALYFTGLLSRPTISICCPDYVSSSHLRITTLTLPLCPTLPVTPLRISILDRPVTTYTCHTLQDLPWLLHCVMHLTGIRVTHILPSIGLKKILRELISININ